MSNLLKSLTNRATLTMLEAVGTASLAAGFLGSISEPAVIWWKALVLVVFGGLLVYLAELEKIIKETPRPQKATKTELLIIILGAFLIVFLGFILFV